MILSRAARISVSEMRPEPKVPIRLHPIAQEILEELSRAPQSGGIIIGGGVALQHYCEYRATVDLDAWWAAAARTSPGCRRPGRGASGEGLGTHRAVREDAERGPWRLTRPSTPTRNRHRS
jgi:hypothetical protein